MAILDIFRPLKKQTVTKWKELGTYQSTFTVFGDDIYSSDVVRSCIRPLADLTAKAEAKCEDKTLERMLNQNPNKYMSGHDFLMKIRTRYELLNVAFIYVQRNENYKVIGLYPVPYSYFEAVEYNNGLFIKFYFSGDATPELILPWEDLVPLRKDYNKSDIAGDDNTAIVKTLEQLSIANQGLANSIRATANLRGILKSKMAMLAAEDVKKQKDKFVDDYLNLENKGGIASLDSTMEFIPVNMSPMTATHEQTKEMRENIMRYFGVNDDLIMANIKSEQYENFYHIRIEPFLIGLSQALTSKVYSGKSAAYAKNQIVYMTDQGQFMTMTQKLELFSKVVLYGGMTKNEWRHLLGYGDIEGGDKPISRLDADYINGNGMPRIGNESFKEEGEEEDGSEG